MRGLRAISLAGLLGLASGLGGQLGFAFAGTGQLRGAEMPEGYGRLVLSFDTAPKTTARIANGVLIVGFSDPSTVVVDKITREMPAYIGVARTDPDGRGLRFALTRNYRVNVIEAGEQVFIDLLPENWKGLQPGLPTDVVEELTRRARLAEARARESAQLAGQQALIKVRGSHAGNLTRVVFDIDRTIPVTFKIEDGQLQASFAKPLRMEQGKLRQFLPEGASVVAAETTADSVKLALAGPKDWEIRAFREDDTFVVDFLRPKPAASPEQAQKPPVEEPKKSRAAQGARPAAEQPKKEIAGGPAPEALKAAAEGKSEPAASAEAAPKPQASPVAQAEPPKAVKIATSRTGDGGRIDFDFGRTASAAAFERQGVVTLVFDTAQGFDPAELPGNLAGMIASAEVERQASAVVIRLALSGRQLARFSPDGARWSLTLGEQSLTAAQPLVPARGIDDTGQTVLSLPVADAATVHWIRIPGLATPWAVATLPGPTRAVVKPYRFVEFDLVPSAQGIVVAPRADDVIVRAGVQEVVVSRNGGLAVSIVGGKAADQASVAAKPPQLVDGALWTEWRLGSVRDRMREAARTAGAAGREQRAVARIKLASILLSNELASEAIGPLEVMQAEDPGFRTDRRVLLLKGMAQALMHRDEQALSTLAIGPLKDDIEAGLWRGLVAARLGQHARALPEFRRAGDILETYPDHFQGVIREQVVRSALAMREFGLAERELKVFSDLPLDLVSRDRVTLLQAMFDETVGKPEAAISAYRALFEASNRQVAAEAQLRGVTLALKEKSKTITDDEAIARLETVSVVWRGDGVELAALGELAHLYAARHRWRDAFSVAKRANEAFPGRAATRDLHDRTAAQFESLFTNGSTEKLPRLEALALFYDFKQFLPVGRRGDEIIRHLADRLVELDLLDQAAELLQYQIDRRLSGAARSVVATRLAMIQLMGGKPADALAALTSTRLPELPSDVKRARLLLEAKALSDLSRTDLAFEILDGEQGPEIERLRADILWTGRRWRTAGEAHERILGEAWRGSEPLSDRERRDVMRAAMAYVMSDEALSLDRLRTKYATRMADTPDARSFAFITAADRGKSADMRELARSVASADTVSEFLDEYRKRYPDYATVQRAKAEARAKEAAAAAEAAEKQAQEAAGDKNPGGKPGEGKTPEKPAESKAGEKAGQPQAEAKPEAKGGKKEG